MHIPRRSWKLVFVSGFWGLRSQTPPRLCPWTTLGDSCLPNPLFCPRSKFLVTPLLALVAFFCKKDKNVNLKRRTGSVADVVEGVEQRTTGEVLSTKLKSLGAVERHRLATSWCRRRCCRPAWTPVVSLLLLRPADSGFR